VHRRALRIHGEIARKLGASIVCGELRPGTLLSGEIEMSAGLGVSRTAYREAVRMLIAKGLVESRPKIGTRITPPERWHLLDPDVLSWIFGTEPPASLLHSLFELRRIIEPEAARLAAERRAPADLDRMAEALDGMARHTLESEAGRAADHAFHTALLQATGNPFMASLAAGVAAAVTWTTIYKQRGGPLPRDPVPDHRAVFLAIRAGDAARAQRAMAVLVDMALADTLAAGRQGGSGG